ncbi:ISAs1-like element ISPsesp1 family transposase [Pseudoalteromonas sp. B131b]|uniref:ISAs1-like element ISPsesp1 family transposase n=1 Tax=Pseudoalteromonas sp. B131b TaxID=630493 RepID=UPI00301CA5A0
MSLFSHLELVKDNRSHINQHHNLVDVLFLIITAVTSGCENWQDIEIYGESKLNWLRGFRSFKNGIPTRHSIARIFRTVDTDSLLLAMYSWVNQNRVKSAHPVIAFDGKTIRGASKHIADKLHLVSAFDCEAGLTLFHQTVGSKTNEIPAVRDLLKILDINNTVITLDALHCQKETLKQLISRHADYLVQAKGNQKKLYSAIQDAFTHQYESENSEILSHVTQDEGHGRKEVHTIDCLDARLLPSEIKESWPSVRTIVAVQRERTKGNRTSIDTHYYLTSLTDNILINKAIRQHWLIENQQHWILDVVFKEDACQIHEPLSAQHMALFRRVVRNMIKQHTKSKGSIRSKCVRACYDDAFREELLFG